MRGRSVGRLSVGWLVPLVITLAVLGLRPAVALASTPVNHTIVGAQQLTVGAPGGTESGGGANIDFWTVQLNGGDRLVLDMSGSTTSPFYHFELYAPGTTDGAFSTGGAPPAPNAVDPMNPYTFATTLASSPPPTSPSPPTSPPPPSTLAVAHQTPAVTTSGLLSVKLTCGGSRCSGTMKLRTAFKSITGRGKRKTTKTTIVTIGSVSFPGLADGAHRISLRLNKTGLRLLKQGGYRLTVTVVVTYKSGSTTKTTRATITLKGTKGKKSTRR